MKNIFFVFCMFFTFFIIVLDCFASGDAEQDAAFFGAVGGFVGSLIDDAVYENQQKKTANSTSGKTYYFTISSGYFRAADNSFYEICEAGAIGYANRVEYIRERNLGPIPPGTYEITNVVQTLHGNSHENVIILNRISSNSYGRDNDFLIHGARTDRSQGNGSNGCILMSKEKRQKIASDFYTYGRGTLIVSE